MVDRGWVVRGWRKRTNKVLEISVGGLHWTSRFHQLHEIDHHFHAFSHFGSSEILLYLVVRGILVNNALGTAGSR